MGSKAATRWSYGLTFSCLQHDCDCTGRREEHSLRRTSDATALLPDSVWPLYPWLDARRAESGATEPRVGFNFVGSTARRTHKDFFSLNAAAGTRRADALLRGKRPREKKKVSPSRTIVTLSESERPPSGRVGRDGTMRD